MKLSVLFCVLLSLFVLGRSSTPEQRFLDLGLGFVGALRLGNFLSPPAAARALAVVHTCGYDAWSVFQSQAIPSDPRFASMNLKWPTTASDSDVLYSVAVAMYRCGLFILSGRPSAEIASFNASFEQLGFSLNQSDNLSLDSVAGIGNLAAEFTMQYRRRDGSNQFGDEASGPSHTPFSDYTNFFGVNDPQKEILRTNCTALRSRNHWQPLLTPSGAQTFVACHWLEVKPFALSHAAEFRPEGPPLMNSRRHEEYLHEVEDIVRQSASLDDRNKMIAEFWAPLDPYYVNPGYVWYIFAQNAARAADLSLDQSVKLMFMVTNALFDAGIAAWDSKRFFNHNRPVTSVHCLYENQEIDAWRGPYRGVGKIRGSNWKPYISTPPFADYISGHSTFSGAAATVLKEYFGSDEFIGPNEFVFEPGSSRIEPRITDPADPRYIAGVTDVPASNNGLGVGYSPSQRIVLSFNTWSEAAEQASMSRNIGGIHIEIACHDGVKVGQAVGHTVFNKAQRLFAGIRKRRCFTV